MYKKSLPYFLKKGILRVLGVGWFSRVYVVFKVVFKVVIWVVGVCLGYVWGIVPKVPKIAKTELSELSELSEPIFYENL